MPDGSSRRRKPVSLRGTLLSRRVVHPSVNDPPGYDPERQERQLRDDSGKEGVDRLLDDLLFAAGETAFLGLPTLLVLVTARNDAAVKWAALVSWTTLAVGVGLARGGWVDVGWPETSARQIALRVMVYSGLIAVASLAGGAVEAAVGSGLGGGAGSALTAALLTGAGLVAFARATGGER